MNRSIRPFQVVVDDRERQSGTIEAFSDMDNIMVTIKRLPMGDYLVDNRLMFERKTLKDFAVSIIDGRLFRQLIAMSRSRWKAVLILEGTTKDLSQVAMARQALQGAIITVSLILGIPILRSRDPVESARLIVYAAKQIDAVVQGGLQRPGYRPRGRSGRQMFILQGLPGIGRDRAQRLLERFGSVEAVMTAGADDLQRVEGIGRITAEKIKWAVSETIAPYGQPGDLPI